MDVNHIQPGDNKITLDEPDTTVYATGGTSNKKYTMEEILQEVKKLMLDSTFPVGSIYITDSNVGTCPIQTKLGGKWELIRSGRVLQQADSTNPPKTYVAAGLPNIKGMDNAPAETYYGRCSGAFYEIPFNESIGSVGGHKFRVSSNGFDASRGVATQAKGIYRDDCYTVQPQAYTVNIWRRTS